MWHYSKGNQFSCSNTKRASLSSLKLRIIFPLQCFLPSQIEIRHLGIRQIRTLAGWPKIEQKLYFFTSQTIFTFESKIKLPKIDSKLMLFCHFKLTHCRRWYLSVFLSLSLTLSFYIFTCLVSLLFSLTYTLENIKLLFGQFEKKLSPLCWLENMSVICLKRPIVPNHCFGNHKCSPSICSSTSYSLIVIVG